MNMNTLPMLRSDAEWTDDSQDSNFMDRIESVAFHLYEKIAHASSKALLVDTSESLGAGILETVQRHLSEIVDRANKQPRLRGMFTRPPDFHLFVNDMITRNFALLPGVAYVWNYIHARLAGRRSLRQYFIQQQPSQRINIFCRAGLLLVRAMRHAIIIFTVLIVVSHLFLCISLSLTHTHFFSLISDIRRAFQLTS